MAKQLETKIRVSLDSAQTVQGLNALRQIDAFEKLRTSAQEASARMFQLRRTVDGLKQAYDGLAADDPNRKLIGQSLAGAERDLQRTTTEFERLKGQVKDARAELTAAGVDVARLANAKIRIQLQVEGSQELDRIRRAQAEILARNATARGNAFDALGLRSIGAVRAEIASVNAALVTLRERGAGPAELARASEAARARLAALNSELRGTQGASGAAGSGLDGVTGRLAGIVSAAVAARTALSAVQSVVQSGFGQSQQQSLVGLGNSGDVAASARAMAFARDESDRLGLSLKVSAAEFAKLNAAAAGTDLAAGQIRDIFSGVAEYATVARLSSEEFSGVMLAVNQILSKGTVSAEELRGQLGERLPGAFQLAAKAVGVTTAELGKMLEQGEVLSAEFLPKFAQALREAAAGGLDAATTGPQANLQRLESAFEQFKRTIADSGVMDALNAELGSFLARIDEMAASGELDKVAKDVADIMTGAIELMATLARGAVALRDEIGLVAQGLLALGAGASVSWAYNLAKGLVAVTGAAGPAAAGIGLVSGALRLIPGLALGLIAIELGAWLLDIARKAQQSGTALEEWKAVVARIAQQNQQFQGEYRKSAEELSGLTREELEAYRQRIKNAQLFYEARGSELAQAGQADLARQFGDEARLYQEHQKDIKAALDGRMANEKELATNVAAVRKGMLSELNAALSAEKQALQQANAELQAAVAQRKSVAAQFAALRQQLSTPVGGSGDKKLSLSDASQAVSRAEAASAQAASATGDEARGKAKEAVSLANQAADVLREIQRQQASLPQSERSINEGDLGFMARRLEEAANQAAAIEQQLAQANQEAAANQVATLEAQIAELSKPVTVNLVTDPANLDAIRAALEQRLQGITVQVNAVPVVAGGDGAPAVDIPANAYGGPLPGYAPHDRADNKLYWGTPGEWVIQRPAVRYYGDDFIRRVNAMQLPRYADGGQIGGLAAAAGSLSSRMASLPIPQLPAAAPGGESLQDLHLHFPQFGSFRVKVERSVADELVSLFQREALAAGRR